MTDLREAAQMALDALDSDNPDIQLRAATHLRAALAQPEQEELGEIIPADEEQLNRIAKLVEQEPQETIAKWIKASTEHKQWYICPKCRHQTPRWKDEWVGLTDEERQECLYSDPIFGMAASTFAHAIEAKLKEKNA